MKFSTPSSKFAVGQKVRVLLEEGNTTAREGSIRDIVWHHKDERHNYYLQTTDGKKVSKRYYEDDLEFAEDSAG